MKRDGFKAAMEHLITVESGRTFIQKIGQKINVNNNITIDINTRQVLIHETGETKTVREGEGKARMLVKLRPYLNIKQRANKGPGKNQISIF